MIASARKNEIEETMKSSILQFARTSIAGILIVALAAPLAQAAPIQGRQNGEPQSQTRPATAQPTQQQALGTAAPDANPQNAPEAPSPQLVDPATRSSSLQSAQEQNNNPVGAAAAPVAKPTGVAASRPAGAVIAPAKQRRAHAILIRVGIIVGAGVAIGTVAGLSRSSSSRP
jgi:hypothetical protein